LTILCVCSLYNERLSFPVFYFFFNVPPTTEIYTLSLHDALRSLCSAASTPSTIRKRRPRSHRAFAACTRCAATRTARSAASPARDRKSTRLNSSHVAISYAVFCLKKKKDTQSGRGLRSSPQPKT